MSCAKKNVDTKFIECNSSKNLIPMRVSPFPQGSQDAHNRNEEFGSQLANALSGFGAIPGEPGKAQDFLRSISEFSNHLLSMRDGVGRGFSSVFRICFCFDHTTLMRDT